MAFDQVAGAFCDHYYPAFQTRQSRVNLQGLYRDDSMMTFQQDRIQGTAAIMAKLTGEDGVKFNHIKHVPASLDAHPTLNNGVLIQVTGHVVIDGDESKPIPFAQTFVLQPLPGTTSYYILSDIFRLIIH
eukprot:TRINITY_DN14273_c0_g1_i1.p1 TRINITY_DN14273_c0_g1~~TRINITY_DN14273_c0_g1_i1.p1  ORF type:complete len:145 (-),score=37.57 TRINITY_DN14273_c0_g1_i1:83-472(-)